MQLKLWDSKTKGLRPKVSIQAMGRFAFNRDADKYMNLKSNPSYVLATKPGDQELAQLFLVETKKVLQAGINPVRAVNSSAYSYINVKNVLDRLGIDYKNRVISYNIRLSNETFQGCRVFVLKRKTNKPRRKNKSSADQAE